MKINRYYIPILSLFLALVVISSCTGCSHRKSLPEKIEKVKISRYEKALFALDPNNLAAGLKNIAKDYRFFIGEGYTDTLNIIQIHDFITDPAIKNLYAESQKAFPDLVNLEQALAGEFYYFKQNLPGWNYPHVYSYVSGLLYEYPVQYYDSVLIIALDMYLGEQFEPYKQLGLPHYKIARMKEEYIAADCAKEIASRIVKPGKNEKTLLDQMVSYGKVLYLMDVALPDVADTLKIGYPGKKMEWCEKNEGNIWAFIIENQLLFSTDSYKTQKFIQDAPFTSGMSNESPGMIGRWLGWRIIRAYVKKSHCSVLELLNTTDSQMILEKSGYKPRQ